MVDFIEFAKTTQNRVATTWYKSLHCGGVDRAAKEVPLCELFQVAVGMGLNSLVGQLSIEVSHVLEANFAEQSRAQNDEFKYYL